MEFGILAAIILALDIYAIWCILQERWSGGKKVIWIIIILVFQVFGMLAYFLFFRERKGTAV
jgi:heme/copper-type cytochrome/quinol oxidase subunit 4